MQHLTQQSPEWHALRRTKIGASDAPIIMGLSPWTTPYQLWLNKLNLYEQPITWSMKEGLRKEEEAREEFEKQTGIIVFSQVMISKEYDWMMASLDGIDIEQKNVVEIKCAGEIDHNIALSGKIPGKYYPQLQHQMFVANVQKMFYFSYGRSSTKLIVIDRNDSYISDMIEKEKIFINCINELIAPELNEKDYDDRNDDLWRETAQKWLFLNSQRKELEKQENEVRELLETMSGPSNSRGAGISLYRSVRKGSIDYQSIPELENVDLEKYRKRNIPILRITANKNMENKNIGISNF